jgi:hypothetical protein
MRAPSRPPEFDGPRRDVDDSIVPMSSRPAQ